MTLSRRIVLHSGALLASLLLLGAAALWSVLGLHRQVRNATKEYAELRDIQQVESHAAQAAERLTARPPDAAAALGELRLASEAAERLAALQEGEKEGSSRHEAVEERGVARTLGVLRAVARDVALDGALDGAAASGAAAAPRPAIADWSAQVRSLRDVRQTLRELAREADVLVAKTQQRTRSTVRDALLATAGAWLVISAVAVALSARLYARIMRPLRALRDGARRVARGTFDLRLPSVGEREFVELTEDFNRMAAELEGLYRDLEAKVAVKSRELVQSERLASVGFLAAGVAHEINNPLGIISGFAELSLKKLRGSGAEPSALEDARRSLQIIRDEAFRCREITEKLLTMSRGGRGDGGAAAAAAARRPVDLGVVVDDVAAMLRAHRAYRGRRVDVDVPGATDLRVLGDEAELRQVLLNLCVNALDAVAAVGAGTVRITARRDAGSVALVVADNGRGMTPDVLAHAFEPFFSARPTRAGYEGCPRGTGLGLSITRAIVEDLGGSIRAESDGPGKGSRFTIALPAARGEPLPGGANRAVARMEA
jgi:signal transduction histidine kinase